MNFLTQFKETIPTISEDLFKGDNISNINIFMSTHIFKEDYADPFYWSANVHFKNGDTSGKKDFQVNGKNGFIKIVQLIEDFIKTVS